MNNTWSPQFLFAVCQRGAELALKREIAAGPIDARPAFSRPGFVTFKLDAPCEKSEQFQLPAVFARTFGFSLGKIQGDRAGVMAQKVWQLPAVIDWLSKVELRDIHVWQRDRAMPGTKSFEPGPTCLAEAAEEAVRSGSPVESLRAMPPMPRRPSPRNGWVLDVVMVEPGEWWIGCHRTARRIDCWPGGVVPLTLPENAASRAYLKMQETLEWSALPTARDETVIELGCAPGGASQALLERGLKVIGVDPAEVDPEILAHPNFLHVRRRSSEVRHRQLLGAAWLAVDMNVAPAYTLDATEEIVRRDAMAVRGLLLTLKLSDWKMADEIPHYVERLQSWGYSDVRILQLAYGRQELCVVALRSRGQRRIASPVRRRTRADSSHASKTRGPHFSTK